jgi:protease I
MASTQLSGKRIAFLVANEGVEQAELEQPRTAMETAGAATTLIAPESGKVQAFNHLDHGDVFTVDTTVGEADAGEFDALVLPGGVANPDALRTNDDAVALIGAFAAAGKPIAAICHAPWTLIEAGLVRGRRVTSWPSLQTDLRNAGAEWVDEQVVVDRSGTGVLITSRKPDDLDAFAATIVDTLHDA